MVAIVFFSYFYASIIFNPTDLADNMRKYGGFIPGIRPGKRTAEYIDRILTRASTLCLAAIVSSSSADPRVLPDFARSPNWFNVIRSTSAAPRC